MVKDFLIEFEIYSYDDKDSGTINCMPEISKVFYRKAESIEQMVNAIKSQKSIRPQLIETETQGPTKARIELKTNGMENVAHYSIVIIEGSYDKDIEEFNATNPGDMY